MSKISKYVSYAEATQTSTGIANVPTEKQLVEIRRVCENVFDKMREHFGVAIKVNSIFRSKEVNKKIGGSATSQHCANNGAAIDFESYDERVIASKELFNYIKDNLLFDQLIWENGNDEIPDWIHVSLKASRNRKQVLRLKNKKYLVY